MADDSLLPLSSTREQSERRLAVWFEISDPVTSNRSGGWYLTHYLSPQKLSALPPELVHKVLSHLSLSQILQLINAHNLPYVESCVLSHFYFGRIFTSTASLSTMKEYHSLYRGLGGRREGRVHPRVPGLTEDIVQLVNWYSDLSQCYEEILASVRVAILSILDVYVKYFPVLSRFASEPIPSREEWDTSDPTMLWKFWKNIDAAERKMNGIKFTQLQRIAKMLLDYPDMLRSSTHHSQESHRHSLQHRVDGFERRARKLLWPCMYAAKSLFTHRFPVVPYDRHLRCFLKVLEKFSVDLIPCPYPPDVAKTVTRAVQGLAYVYPRGTGEPDSHSEHRVLRTKFTAYSAKGQQSSRAYNQPCFIDFDVDDTPSNASPELGMLPMAEREFEWREAFLESCRFMSEMGNEWMKGMTVKEYWILHTGGTAAQPVI